MEPEREWQRWTARRKVELLLQLIRGEKTLVEVCREHDLKQSDVEGWMDVFLKPASAASRAAPRTSRPRTSARCASSVRRSGSSSWSSTPEKSWMPSPGNPRKPSDGAGPHA